MIRNFSVAVLASFTLQGCMFSPGQHMDTSEIVREGTSESSRVELIPITPKLIAMNSTADTLDLAMDWECWLESAPDVDLTDE